MDELRLSRLEDRLRALEDRVRGLESLLATQAGATAPAPSAARSLDREIVAAGQTAAAESTTDASAPNITLLGRLLIILGGAFLLRAATQMGVLPGPVGVTLGILYGVAQILLAARASARDLHRSANWFGLGSAAIVLPLLVEATLDLAVLPHVLTTILLTALASAGVFVAWRGRLRLMAWAFLAGGGTVGLVLAVRTGFGPGFPLAVIFIGLVGLWLGYLRRWHGLAIVGSVVPVALVGGVSLLVALEYEGDVTAHLSPAVGLILQLTLVAGFLGSFFARALRWSAPVGVPEVVQSVFALTIGILGALVSVHKDPSLRFAFGVVMLGFGAFSYVVSFTRIDRREGSRANFAFFSSVALAAALTGSAMILSGDVVLGFFILVALVLAYAGARLGRATLSLHAAIFVTGAGFACGLVPMAVDALTGEMVAPPPPAQLMKMLLVIAVAIVCGGAPVVSEGRTLGRLSSMPTIVYLLFLLFAIDGVLVQFAANTVLHTADPGMIAALRTGALAISAIVYGFLARVPKLRPARALVNAVLVLGALALLLGDLRDGRPATQFASLALYGAALILAPRLARRGREEPDLPDDGHLA